MMATIPLKCRCGAVQGQLTDVSPKTGNRVVCCCDDCQNFANSLTHGQDTLDEFGGTDIYQACLANFEISQGKDKLQSMRLMKKGMLRWYTACCETPIGNTLSETMPLVGVIRTFMDIDNPKAVMGDVRAYVQTQHAKGNPTYPKHHPKFPLGLKLPIILNILKWKKQAKNKPSVFFQEDGRPIVKPIIASL